MIDKIKDAFEKRFPLVHGDFPHSPFHLWIFEEGYKAAMEEVEQIKIDVYKQACEDTHDAYKDAFAKIIG